MSGLRKTIENLKIKSRGHRLTTPKLSAEEVKAASIGYAASIGDCVDPAELVWAQSILPEADAPDPGPPMITTDMTVRQAAEIYAIMLDRP